MQATQTQRSLTSVQGDRGLFSIFPMTVLSLRLRFGFLLGFWFVFCLIGSEQLQFAAFLPPPSPQLDFPPSSNRCPSIEFVQKYRFGMPTAERSNWSKEPLQQPPALQCKHTTSTAEGCAQALGTRAQAADWELGTSCKRLERAGGLGC